MRHISMRTGIPPIFLPTSVISQLHLVRWLTLIANQIPRKGIIQLRNRRTHQRLFHGRLISRLSKLFQGFVILQNGPFDSRGQDHIPREGDGTRVNVEGISHGGSSGYAFGECAVEGFFSEVFGDDVGSKGVAEEEDGSSLVDYVVVVIVTVIVIVRVCWICAFCCVVFIFIFIFIFVCISSCITSSSSTSSFCCCRSDQPFLQLQNNPPQIPRESRVIRPRRRQFHSSLPSHVDGTGHPTSGGGRPHHGSYVSEGRIVVHSVEE
mmetsp:Transcript_22419/g.47133  ORF Transcript_22419/g.47133 Transcript_22419/m.47133 type:complete len:265 (-) Transcript_22419:337-1131(-)